MSHNGIAPLRLYFNYCWGSLGKIDLPLGLRWRESQHCISNKLPGNIHFYNGLVGDNVIAYKCNILAFTKMDFCCFFSPSLRRCMYACLCHYISFANVKRFVFFSGAFAFPCVEIFIPSQ